jgi:hypothetical protein
VTGRDPEGSALFGYRARGGAADVFRYDLASQTRTVLRRIEPADRAGVSGISSVSLSEDGASYLYAYPRILSDLYLVEGLR